MLRVLSTLAVVTAVLATPSRLSKRGDIDSDKVVGFPETVPSGIEGALMLQYQPFLYVVDGCVPFPAVDAQGDTSAGLNPSGNPSGGCSSSIGQIYSRAATYNGSYAIMYSWFFPKDEPSWGESVVGVGHRYDWENTVVWLSDASASATLRGVAASYHGKYKTETDLDSSNGHPLIQYYTAYHILDHSCGFTDTVGGTQPLIAWDLMPSVAQQALADKDWGDANVPFSDANFNNNLALAQL